MQQLTTATSAGVTLSLGMLNLMVSVHGAVGEDTSSSLRVVCTHGHGPTPVRQNYFCPACSNNGVDVPFEKAREMPEGLVVIPAEVQEAAKAEAAVFKKSAVITVHPAHEVTSVLMPSGKSYYLSMKTPSLPMLETYTLLGQLVLALPELAFMTKMTLRSATSLFQLTVAGEGTLVLRQMADAELVREHPVISFAALKPRMLELAKSLAHDETTKFLVAEHGSGKSNAIAAYASTQTPVPMAGDGVAASTGNVLDLMAMLEASVGAAKKAPAKKVAAKVPAARGAAAKKLAAKPVAAKTAARTTASKTAPVRPTRTRKVS